MNKKTENIFLAAIILFAIYTFFGVGVCVSFILGIIFGATLEKVYSHKELGSK